MPNILRRIQQAWWFHLVIAAVIIAVSTAFQCYQKNDTVTWECTKLGIVAAGTYLWGIFQHSPHSPLFTKFGARRHVV
jgi:hypothetical protein